MRILACYDERIPLELLTEAIREARSEAELIGFSDPAELLAFAEHSRADVAFLDIQMYGITGLELAKRLKDKPLSNLDAKLRNQMRAELIKLRQRVDGTFVYVTHDQTEAMTLGDRIVIMKDGVVQQIGTPQDVFEHPANLFVASFIGVPQMNFFDGELVKNGEKYAVKTGGTEIALTDGKSAQLAAAGIEARGVTMGIRPEHIMLCKPGEPGAITGKIDVSEMMGSSIHVHATVDGRDIVMVIPTLELSSDFKGSFKTAQDLTFAFNPDSIHLFDPESGNNLI